MIESHVIDSALPYVAVVHSWMAENATTSPPTPGTVLSVGVQACGVSNFNGVLKLKGTLVVTSTAHLSLKFPPKKVTT
jgi:hypothetical protein